ncbi:cytochrome c oxidase assembly protein [Dermacoccus nishinomiyaensis]|uniref:cytochrome c oxidase assembly protein n=2 Tax=Dermacoccus TaxID=57495 RepID=UPI00142EE71C|nr:cytochrome c oxidase assembly protein [Dermacoccus nishinomiyaensis]
MTLGAPFRLTLRAVPHRGSFGGLLRTVTAIVYSRPHRIMLHPAFGIPLFLLTYYGLYLSDLGSRLLGTWAGHNGLEIGFLAAGVLFAVPILTVGPGPVHPTHLGRMLDVFAEMALHAFFGVLIMMTPTTVVAAFAAPPRSWGIDPVADQQIAGGLAWSYGEGPATAIVAYLVWRWYRYDSARSASADRDADRSGDPELAAYNRYLAVLAARDGRGDTETTQAGRGSDR